jgi:hypothetical protein
MAQAASCLHFTREALVLYQLSPCEICTSAGRQVFLQVLGFSSVIIIIIIPPMAHTHLHLHVACARTNGRGLGTVQVWKSGSIE